MAFSSLEIETAKITDTFLAGETVFPDNGMPKPRKAGATTVTKNFEHPCVRINGRYYYAQNHGKEVSQKYHAGKNGKEVDQPFQSLKDDTGASEHRRERAVEALKESLEPVSNPVVVANGSYSAPGQISLAAGVGDLNQPGAKKPTKDEETSHASSSDCAKSHSNRPRKNLQSIPTCQLSDSIAEPKPIYQGSTGNPHDHGIPVARLVDKSPTQGECPKDSGKA